MTRFRRLIMTLTLVCAALTPRAAAAQQQDGWTFSLVPLYFWMSELDGRMTAGPVTVPILLEFSQAKDNLAGAFSFHFEAGKGRWGVMTDLNFIKLATNATFAVGPSGGLAVAGDAELDNVMFEGGVIYLVNPDRRFGILGGVRTYTLSPKITFSGPAGGATPIDGSKTSVDGFAGFAFRPRFNEKWALISRADIGAGMADLTWSAVLGLEFRFKTWGSLDFGYKALGIDFKTDDAAAVREYDVTHYGPILGLRLHWGAK